MNYQLLNERELSEMLKRVYNITPFNVRRLQNVSHVRYGASLASNQIRYYQPDLSIFATNDPKNFNLSDKLYFGSISYKWAFRNTPNFTGAVTYKMDWDQIDSFNLPGNSFSDYFSRLWGYDNTNVSGGSYPVIDRNDVYYGAYNNPILVFGIGGEVVLSAPSGSIDIDLEIQFDGFQFSLI
jgi:hypothetical protein